MGKYKLVKYVEAISFEEAVAIYDNKTWDEAPAWFRAEHQQGLMNFPNIRITPEGRMIVFSNGRCAVEGDWIVCDYLKVFPVTGRVFAKDYEPV